MSATRDNSQKVAFVFSNLYSIYQKGKAAAQEAVLPSDSQAEALAESHAKAQVAPFVVTPVTSGLAVTKSGILKVDDLHKPEYASVKISDYSPATMIGKRVARPLSIAQPLGAPSIKMAAKPVGAVAGLKENLKALNDLHSRLRFMLQELEELVRK